MIERRDGKVYLSKEKEFLDYIKYNNPTRMELLSSMGNENLINTVFYILRLRLEGKIDEVNGRYVLK